MCAVKLQKLLENVHLKESSQWKDYSKMYMKEREWERRRQMVLYTVMGFYISDVLTSSYSAR
jgi:hypothetical protein